MNRISRNHLFGRGGAVPAVVLLLSVCMLVSMASQAAVLRVNAASTAATPDGQSWATAFPTIQPAVDAAAADDEIWVAAGTYTGTGFQVVNLVMAIKLYGGFAGTESTRDQREWKGNPTIIDGEGTRRGIAAVVSATVDGFTFRNGSAYQGGGMIWGAAANCDFEANKAVQGGGLFGAHATNCTFTGNAAEVDGGGMCQGTATNCKFIGNRASGPGMYDNKRGDGGGMHSGYAVNCLFTGNSAEVHGGGFTTGQADNCIFVGNSANWGGGCMGAIALNCTFFNNTAVEREVCDCSEDGQGGYTCDCYPYEGHYGAVCSGKAANCVVWDNGPEAVSADAEVVYSCLSETVPGTGNIVADPRFVDAASQDFRLQGDSPCIDTGTALWAPDGPSPVADMLSVSRPQGAGYDMGAYEMVLVTVPDLSGLVRSAARQMVAAASLYVCAETEEYDPAVAPDHVVRQTPPAGTKVPRDMPVDLVISRGPQPPAMPDVIGQTQEAATEAITGSGLAVGTVSQEYSLAVPVGSVISQSVAAGAEVPPGTAVDFVVSRGGIAVPDVTGQAQNAASSVITGSGLVVGTVTQQGSATVPVGAVISQSPSAGASVLPGAAVALVISLGAQPCVVPDVVGLPQAQAEAAIAGAGLALGNVTQAYSDTAAAGIVLSQSPAAGAELSPGRVVGIVVSLGSATAEGEGEPAAVTAEQLADVYDAADTNGDGALSFSEAVAAVTGLTQAVFNELDTNGDGQLASDELGVDASAGCTGCQGSKKAFDPTRMGDLFLMALGALGLAAMAPLRRR